jgi:hypothetical protein
MSLAYSFLNTSCKMVGPGIISDLGAGAATAEEGITLSATTDKNVMTIGADGLGQHSLIADDSAQIKISLLKTSPLNAALMIAYDLQSSSSALWGINTLTLSDAARGDFHVIQQVAFKKKPEIKQAKEAGMIEWELEGITANSILGGGI